MLKRLILWLRRLCRLGTGIGLIKIDTLMTTRHFTPTVPMSHFANQGEWLDFLRAHPAGQFPRYWREDRAGRRAVRHQMVTDDFVEELVDTLQSSVAAFSLYKYHHSGTGTGDESAENDALGTPKEDARAVGTQVETSSKVYKSVATITYTNTWAITEHGLFNTAGAGGPPVVGGVLMDRTKFAAVNVVTGNQIQFTFEITFTSGG